MFTVFLAITIIYHLENLTVMIFILSFCCWLLKVAVTAGREDLWFIILSGKLWSLVCDSWNLRCYWTDIWREERLNLATGLICHCPELWGTLPAALDKAKHRSEEKNYILFRSRQRQWSRAWSSVSFFRNRVASHQIKWFRRLTQTQHLKKSVSGSP